LHIQLSVKAERITTKLIGMDAGAYLILQPQNPAKLIDQVFKGKEVVVRYLSDGAVFGFESKVIDFMVQPARLLFLTIPRKFSPVRSGNTSGTIVSTTPNSSWPEHPAAGLSPTSAWAVVSSSPKTLTKSRQPASRSKTVSHSVFSRLQGCLSNRLPERCAT